MPTRFIEDILSEGIEQIRSKGGGIDSLNATQTNTP